DRHGCAVPRRGGDGRGRRGRRRRSGHDRAAARACGEPTCARATPRERTRPANETRSSADTGLTSVRPRAAVPVFARGSVGACLGSTGPRVTHGIVALRVRAPEITVPRRYAPGTRRRPAKGARHVHVPGRRVATGVTWTCRAAPPVRRRVLDRGRLTIDPHRIAPDGIAVHRDRWYDAVRGL